MVTHQGSMPNHQGETYDSWKSSDCSEAPPTLSSSIRRRLMAVEAITGTPGAGVPTDMSTQSLMLESWSDAVNKRSTINTAVPNSERIMYPSS